MQYLNPTPCVRCAHCSEGVRTWWTSAVLYPAVAVVNSQICCQLDVGASTRPTGTSDHDYAGSACNAVEQSCFWISVGLSKPSSWQSCLCNISKEEGGWLHGGEETSAKSSMTTELGWPAHGPCLHRDAQQSRNSSS